MRATAILIILIAATTAVLPLGGCRCTPQTTVQVASCCQHQDTSSVGRPCCTRFRVESVSRAMPSRAQATPTPYAAMAVLPLPPLTVLIDTSSVTAPQARGRPPGARWLELSPILRV